MFCFFFKAEEGIEIEDRVAFACKYLPEKKVCCFKTHISSFKPHTVNPLLAPWGAYLFQAHFGLFDGGCLFNLEKTIVWALLYKELEYKVEKLKYKKVGCHAAEDQNQIRTSSQ